LWLAAKSFPIENIYYIYKTWTRASSRRGANLLTNKLRELLGADVLSGWTQAKAGNELFCGLIERCVQFDIVHSDTKVSDLLFCIIATNQEIIIGHTSEIQPTIAVYV
jgi:hypothetical protein